MKKLVLLLFFIVSNVAFAQKKSTLNYFKDDTLSLDLDLYLPEKKSNDKLPLVIYVHGGGFSGGERKSGEAFCNYLAKNGFAAATISYTLYAKGRDYGCNGKLPEKIKAFQYAANDVWLATNFFLKNASKYNLNTEKIFVSGSSAGAEAVLHAAFWDFNTMNLYDKMSLPKNFKYAGLISGAGALMDVNLINEKNIIPMFFFHGSKDTVVPYATAVHHGCPTNASNWLMLFGSKSIYEKSVSLNTSASLFTFCGGGHEYSGRLFEKDHQYILNFLNAVLSGKKVQEHVAFATE